MANPENKQIPYESTQKDIRDAIESVATAIGGIAIPSADHVSYDNSGSGLSATDVQNALDEIVSDIPTVNDGTLTIQQNGETKGTFTANQSGNSTVNIETPTADIQTAVDEFSTYNGGLLSECKVALSPDQDLHGYDHPWAGGAGKNKLPLVLADIKSANPYGTWSGNVYTRNGGTFEVLVDDSDNVLGVKVNGTFTSSVTFYIASAFTLKAGSYIFSGDSSLNSDFRYRFNDGAFFAVQSSDVTKNYGSDTNITRAEIVVESGYTVSNKTLTPMVRLSSESDPTFEPYSNICPITGHTEVDVDVSDGQTTQEQVTVNLGGTYYSGVLDVVSGVFTLTHVMWSDDGSKNWARNADGSFYVFYTDTHPLAVQDAEGCACDYAPFVLSFDGMSVFARANGLVSLGRGWGSIYPDAASLKAQFAIEPFQMVYKLASPQSIQLSPTMVKALVGENHLSAPLDGQEITESKYKQMFTFDDVIAYIQSLS